MSNNTTKKREILTEAATDSLINRKSQRIQWFHIPSGEEVSFAAFVTEYKDSFTSDWNETHVYGRMDGIETFKRTKRVISLGWKVLAYGVSEAKDNLGKMSLLMKMLYPTYDTGGTSSFSLGSTAISSSPLMRLKFMNFISQPNETAGSNVKTSGLVGKVAGFDFEPNFDAGFLGTKTGELLPKELQVSCQLTVLHTHPLGCRRYADDKDRSSFRQSRYPYGEAGGRNELQLIAESEAGAGAAKLAVDAASGIVNAMTSADASDEQREAVVGKVTGGSE
jgi:hypothetical protein